MIQVFTSEQAVAVAKTQQRRIVAARITGDGCCDRRGKVGDGLDSIVGIQPGVDEGLVMGGVFVKLWGVEVEFFQFLGWIA
jgi:hypothetical protein